MSKIHRLCKFSKYCRNIHRNFDNIRLDDGFNSAIEDSKFNWKHRELAAHPAAIDRHYRAMDIVRGGRRQEHHSAGKVVRFSPTASRNAFQN